MSAGLRVLLSINRLRQAEGYVEKNLQELDVDASGLLLTLTFVNGFVSIESDLMCPVGDGLGNNTGAMEALYAPHKNILWCTLKKLFRGDVEHGSTGGDYQGRRHFLSEHPLSISEETANFIRPILILVWLGNWRVHSLNLDESRPAHQSHFFFDIGDNVLEVSLLCREIDQAWQIAARAKCDCSPTNRRPRILEFQSPTHPTDWRHCGRRLRRHLPRILKPEIDEVAAAAAALGDMKHREVL